LMRGAGDLRSSLAERWRGLELNRYTLTKTMSPRRNSPRVVPSPHPGASLCKISKGSLPKVSLEL
jgi:hypothetical protein